MIYLGFGFLMTFLKRYSWSAVSLNFVLSCLMMLEGILAVSVEGGCSRGSSSLANGKL